MATTADDYCVDSTCPGYGTLKATHHNVARRSDGGRVDLKDGKKKEDGPNRLDDDRAPTVRHG